MKWTAALALAFALSPTFAAAQSASAPHMQRINRAPVVRDRTPKARIHMVQVRQR